MDGQRTQNLKANDGSVLKLSQCVYKKYRNAKHEATKAGLMLEVFPDGRVALKDKKTLEYVFGDAEHRKAVKAILRHFKRIREKQVQAACKEEADALIKNSMLLSKVGVLDGAEASREKAV